MTFEENKTFWEEFIEMYRNLPCLWDAKSKEYSNRQRKDKAYGILVQKAKEIKADADKNYVIKKISSLRSSFRRQLRKMKEGWRTGSATEPTLWYYELLMFTLDQDEEEVPEFETVSVGSSVKLELLEDNFDDIPLSHRIVHPNPIQETYKRKCLEEDQSSKLKKSNDFTDVGTQQYLQHDAGEEWEVFGKSVELQMKSLANEQSIIAQKLINDVLFYAKIGKLTNDSTIQVPTSLTTSSH